MERAQARSHLPVFQDPRLVRHDVMHKAGCPAGLRADGGLGLGRCRCIDILETLPRGSVVSVLRRQLDASLIQAPGNQPVWVETEGLQETTRPLPEAPSVSRVVSEQDLPRDYQLVHTYLSHKMGGYDERRMRPIHGGEIVFVREEKNRAVLSPKRFICQATLHEGETLILIHPSIPRVRGLSPDWAETWYISNTANRKLEQLLYPVFPLPNGAKDPGWIPNLRGPQ